MNFPRRCRRKRHARCARAFAVGSVTSRQSATSAIDEASNLAEEIDPHQIKDLVPSPVVNEALNLALEEIQRP